MQEVKPLTERELEALSSALQEQAPHMDLENREKVAKAAKVTERTVRTYLKGEVGDKEMGRKILALCRANIMKREQELSNHIS